MSNEQFKINSVIPLPLKAAQHEEHNGWWTIDKPNGCCIDESADGGFDEDTAKTIAHSVNNFDSVVEGAGKLLHLIEHMSFHAPLDDEDKKLIKEVTKAVNQAKASPLVENKE